MEMNPQHPLHAYRTLFVKNLNQWNTKAPQKSSHAVHAVQFPRPQGGDVALLIATTALAQILILIAVAPHGKEGKGHQWDIIPKNSS